jgi:hypothetical protein
LQPQTRVSGVLQPEIEQTTARQAAAAKQKSGAVAALDIDDALTELVLRHGLAWENVIMDGVKEL